MPPQLIQTCVCQVSPSFLDFPGRRAPGRYGVMHPPCQRLGGGGQRIRSSRPASPATASLRPVWAMGEILPESRTKQNVQVSPPAWSLAPFSEGRQVPHILNSGLRTPTCRHLTLESQSVSQTHRGSEKLLNRGWGDVPVGTVLARKASGPEFGCPAPTLKVGYPVLTGLGGFPGVLLGSSWLSEKLSQKYKVKRD